MPPRNLAIVFGVFATPLGPALLAATGRGLCALRLCERGGAQAQEGVLRADFPQAHISEDPEAVRGYADALIGSLGARTGTFRPPLDIVAGTPFQREVWAALQTIPAGETLSYTELAARVGRPSAVRAVAGACARNGIAIAIPCHRAVRSDGALAGFRWGLAWKRHLLDIEAGMRPLGLQQGRIHFPAV